MGSDRETLVGAALGQCAASVELLATGSWAIELTNGTDLRAHVWLDHDWLRLNAALATAEPDTRGKPDLIRLLSCNGVLPGGAKLCVTAETLVCVRAEWPVDDHVDLTHRTLDACRGLKLAAELASGIGSDGQAHAQPSLGIPQPTDLVSLCKETGWPFVERAGGTVAVELDVPNAFEQASVSARESDGPLVGVDVGTSTPTSRVCREAVAALLLRTGSIVRMARPALPAGNQIAPRFEIAFSHFPSAGELGHAFSALSVACRLVCREALVLHCDQRIAREYLRQCGFANAASEETERHTTADG